MTAEQKRSKGGKGLMGDWESRPTLNTNAGVFEIVCNGKTLAFVQGNDLGHSGGNPVSFEMARTISRLMAASPDMYATLEAVIEDYEFLIADHPELDPDGEFTKRLSMIRKAVAKANGE